EKISYQKLLEEFWRSIDPTQEDGQFADIGKQYRTAIFYHDDAQLEAAVKSKEALSASKKFDKPIVTSILPAMHFYPAENSHQDYYQKNSAHYEAYSVGSGRKGFLKKTWEKIEK